MGITELRKQGCNLKRLSDKMVKFCLAYLIHGNGTQAATDAGYKKSSARFQAAKLLADPRIKALIGKRRREQGERFEIESDMVLEHLCSCVCRDGKDFVDADGVLLVNNIQDLPDDVTRAIDGIEQTETTFTDKDGVTTRTVTTKLKLVSKGVALKLAMDHKGLFAAVKVEGRVALDLDKLYRDTGIIDVDPIQERLDQERNSGPVGGNGRSSGNGNGKAKPSKS